MYNTRHEEVGPMMISHSCFSQYSPIFVTSVLPRRAIWKQTIWLLPSIWSLIDQQFPFGKRNQVNCCSIKKSHLSKNGWKVKELIFLLKGSGILSAYIKWTFVTQVQGYWTLLRVPSPISLIWLVVLMLNFSTNQICEIWVHAQNMYL